MTAPTIIGDVLFVLFGGGGEDVGDGGRTSKLVVH